MRKIPANVPRTVIELDRPRTMTLQLDALKRIKDQTGSFDIPVEGDAMFDRAPVIIWCALVDGDREDLSPEDVAGMIHAGNLGGIVGALADLVRQSSPTAKGAEGNDLPVPAKVRKAASR